MNEQELTQDQIDEQTCGERVNYWLKKCGCTLHGQAILENGSVIVRVGITKIPLEIRQKMKEAEKRGQSIPMEQNTAPQN